MSRRRPSFFLQKKFFFNMNCNQIDQILSLRRKRVFSEKKLTDNALSYFRLFLSHVNHGGVLAKLARFILFLKN
jgi:hypothetical protein